jgi:hypothetical protein
MPLLLLQHHLLLLLLLHYFLHFLLLLPQLLFLFQFNLIILLYSIPLLWDKYWVIPQGLHLLVRLHINHLLCLLEIHNELDRNKFHLLFIHSLTLLISLLQMFLMVMALFLMIQMLLRHQRDMQLNLNNF